MANFKLVKKVSSQVFGLTKAEMQARLQKEGAPKQIYLGRIQGEARSTRVVPTAFGDATALVGTFQGFDGAGNEYRAGTCYVPGGYDGDLISALSGENNTNSVFFCFDFYAELNSRNDVRFACVPHGEFVDPLAQYTANLPALPIALSAPVDQPLLEGVEEPQGKGKGKKTAA